ncbi:hypothetical protein CONPUDRAFT_166658 [Coniophora puteana RWD-64-598 SS2]|uniref:Uncharacterized protein n=1 Tax=Coniophora puteana (strain RWD-64-598) TaxID=741705 RepID=A0A5M3MLE6_CONPW|nr:uncharacterized protein CONPUDRAFT_166658 [Coniophora puteana RWD-64-598 SS2]EIW80049.1 hypothetical protein CONPUDRAFT_166658 [Coniophora puteana RWD-64-598 SS2]
MPDEGYGQLRDTGGSSNPDFPHGAPDPLPEPMQPRPAWRVVPPQGSRRKVKTQPLVQPPQNVPEIETRSEDPTRQRYGELLAADPQFVPSPPASPGPNLAVSSQDIVPVSMDPR